MRCRPTPCLKARIDMGIELHFLRTPTAIRAGHVSGVSGHSGQYVEDFDICPAL